MTAEIGNENLVVCFSEYLPIYVIIGLKCCLGLPVVRPRAPLPRIHDSSLLLCFSNILAHFI